MVVIVRVFISFSSVLRALNLAFREASFINRYGHYRCSRCTAHHRTENGEPVSVCAQSFNFSLAARRFRAHRLNKEKWDAVRILYTVKNKASYVLASTYFAERQLKNRVPDSTIDKVENRVNVGVSVSLKIDGAMKTICWTITLKFPSVGVFIQMTVKITLICRLTGYHWRLSWNNLFIWLTVKIYWDTPHHWPIGTLGWRHLSL